MTSVYHEFACVSMQAWTSVFVTKHHSLWSYFSYEQVYLYLYVSECVITSALVMID